MTTAQEPGTLRVVRGEPTAEELAAVLAVVAARAADAEEAPSRSAAVSGWTDRARTMTRTPRPGPGAWRASAW